MWTFSAKGRPFNMQTARHWTALIFLNIYVMAVLSPGFIAAADGSVDFESQQNRLILSYPDVFEEIKAPNTPAALMLQQKHSRFPTFNLIVQSCAYNLNAVIEKQAEDVVHSYRLVGLTDTALRNARLTLKAGVVAFESEVAYRQDGKPFVSIVTIIPGKDRHFIMTFLDRREQLEQDRHWLDKILSSFNAADLQKQTPKSDSRSYWLFLVVFLGVDAVVILIWYLRRNKENS
jgi:hypothetical protein